MDEKVYKCIKAFSVNAYDEDEFLVEDERFDVPKDSIWEHEDEDYSMNDIRLRDKAGRWLDIDIETLKTHFIIQ